MAAEKYPILWDNQWKDFRNKKAQDIMQLLLSENLKRDVTDIQYQWKYIQTGYVAMKQEVQ